MYSEWKEKTFTLQLKEVQVARVLAFTLPQIRFLTTVEYYGHQVTFPTVQDFLSYSLTSLWLNHPDFMQ